MHRILTCNILLDLPEQKGNTSWEKKRREACFHVIRAHTPDIFCLQEVGHRQNEEFEKAFKEYASFGFVDPASDRHPPRFKAIRNVIFYKRARYELTSASAYWISPTPLAAGTGLAHQNLARHATWVRLRDKDNGHEFRVVDTHFPLLPEERVKTADFVVSETSQYAAEFPQIMCGDFNAETPSAEVQRLLAGGWKDTYTAVVPADKQSSARKIDFVFIRGNVKPVAAGLILDEYNGVRPSDHYFVWADVMI